METLQSLYKYLIFQLMFIIMMDQIPSKSKTTFSKSWKDYCNGS